MCACCWRRAMLLLQEPIPALLHCRTARTREERERAPALPACRAHLQGAQVVAAASGHCAGCEGWRKHLRPLPQPRCAVLEFGVTSIFHVHLTADVLLPEPGTAHSSRHAHH